MLGDGQFLIKRLDGHVLPVSQGLWAKALKPLHRMGGESADVVDSDSSTDGSERDNGDCSAAACSEAGQLICMLCWGAVVVVGLAVVHKHTRGLTA